jgi:nucleoside-diphosphate-sugar epimerase
MPAPGLERTVVGDLGPSTNWSSALINVDCVIHCAARTPVMCADTGDSLDSYRLINVEGTRRLAEQAAIAGVRRFIYLSSIKVNGESAHGATAPAGARLPSTSGIVGSAVPDEVLPKDAYGVSKLEAEQALWEISAETGLEAVVVRPPLVYGPGAKGNLERLLRLARLGLPLPFGAVKNKRSFIGLDNLVDFLMCCVDHPAAAGQTLSVSDGVDLSTPDFLRHVAVAMDRNIRLFPLPVSLLRAAGHALGKGAELDRLVGSLQIDSDHSRRVLGWTPPVSVYEGIRRMVQDK